MQGNDMDQSGVSDDGDINALYHVKSYTFPSKVNSKSQFLFFFAIAFVLISYCHKNQH